MINGFYMKNSPTFQVEESTKTSPCGRMTKTFLYSSPKSCVGVRSDEKWDFLMNQWTTFCSFRPFDTDTSPRLITVLHEDALYFLSDFRLVAIEIPLSFPPVMLPEHGVIGSSPFCSISRQTEASGHISLVSKSLTRPGRLPSFSCTDGIKWQD